MSGQHAARVSLRSQRSRWNPRGAGIMSYSGNTSGLLRTAIAARAAGKTTLPEDIVCHRCLPKVYTCSDLYANHSLLPVEITTSTLNPTTDVSGKYLTSHSRYQPTISRSCSSTSRRFAALKLPHIKKRPADSWTRNFSSNKTPIMSSTHVLTKETINPHVRAAQYAVRGVIPQRAEEYRAKLAKGQGKELPFDSVIFANIGNPQQLDQKPITFFRQVASLLEWPDLLEKEDALVQQLGYPKDAIARARRLLKEVKSVGAYSNSSGALGIRESVAQFIERRDGYPADPAHVYLSAGASSGVNTLLHVICAGPETGILVPIPQYPLYTATLSVLNAKCVPYNLDEGQAWGTNLDTIKESLAKAKGEGADVKAIVVINPGNPTGSSLTKEDIVAVLKFASEENLVVMADEVYQTNVFIGEFFSFKKCLRELQEKEPGKYDGVELASLHSISKGMVGECGHRGGYFELVGFDKEVEAEIYKFISIMLCPPVLGQCLVECMVNPPKGGEESYELYKKEYDSTYEGLKKRANALHKAFAEMEGVSCQDPQGSMYLFPTITLPEKALEAAKKEDRKADEFYCINLLDQTGICVVPGSGFGQKEGTLHFRTTFLAPGTEWVNRIVDFHKKFMDQYR